MSSRSRRSLRRSLRSNNSRTSAGASVLEKGNDSMRAKRRKRTVRAAVSGADGKRRKQSDAKVAMQSVHSIADALGRKMGDSEVITEASNVARRASESQPLLLLDLGKENLVKATMICRPSKRNKSPYVADVLLESGREAIAHVPCLDMGGKCVHGAKLLLKVARDRKGVPVGPNQTGKYGTPKCEFICQPFGTTSQNTKHG